MEITAKPRRPRRRRALRLLVVTAAVVSMALLLPPALGLGAHVVPDDAMAGTHARGSLVFDEQVPLGQLEVGDVVTFRVPDGGERVTRRVVSIGDDGVRTRGDAVAAADPWRVAPADVERVAFALPLLGWPLVVAGSVPLPPWTPAGLVLGLAGLLVLLRRVPAAAGDDHAESLPEPVRAVPGAPPVG